MPGQLKARRMAPRCAQLSQGVNLSVSKGDDLLVVRAERAPAPSRGKGPRLLPGASATVPARPTPAGPSRRGTREPAGPADPPGKLAGAGAQGSGLRAASPGAEGSPRPQPHLQRRQSHYSPVPAVT